MTCPTTVKTLKISWIIIVSEDIANETITINNIASIRNSSDPLRHEPMGVNLHTSWTWHERSSTLVQ